VGDDRVRGGLRGPCASGGRGRDHADRLDRRIPVRADLVGHRAVRHRDRALLPAGAARRGGPGHQPDLPQPADHRADGLAHVQRDARAAGAGRHGDRGDRRRVGEPAMSARRLIRIDEPGDVWFFAYGSLMWDPGFEPADVRSALLRGWHRAFCVSSVIYRGTPQAPGLTLGLDRGGSCRGRALRIAADRRDAVLDYIAEREMPEEIYSCRQVRVETPEGPLDAWTLVVNRDHALYV